MRTSLVPRAFRVLAPDGLTHTKPSAGAGAFVPTQLTGLQVWLDAAAITGLADTDPVSTWSDLSGAGRDAIQATGTKQPLYRTNLVNGKPAVRFDGTDDYLKAVAFTLAQPITVCIVARAVATPATYANFVDGNAIDTLACFTEPAETRWRIYAGGGVVGVTDLGTTNFHVLAGVFDGAASATYVDGTQAATGNAGTATPGGLILGAGSTAAQFLNCDLAEVTVYNRALATGELATLALYLGTKYAITVA